MNLVFFKFNESLLALNHIDNLFSSAFSIPFFFICSRPNEETLDTQAIMFYDVFQMGIVCWTPAIVDL